MTQTREKWNTLVLNGMKVSWYFVFSFLFFCLETTVKKLLDENDFRHGFGNYFESAILKVTCYQLCSKLFLNNYEAHLERCFKYTLQL